MTSLLPVTTDKTYSPPTYMIYIYIYIYIYLYIYIYIYPGVYMCMMYVCVLYV